MAGRRIGFCTECQEERPWISNGRCARCYQRDRKLVDYQEIRRKRLATEFYALVDAAKAKPCMDCGIQYAPWVMDLDHRPDETKIIAVSQMVMLKCSLTLVQAEIDKCDVVCSNCHRIRTHERQAK